MALIYCRFNLGQYIKNENLVIDSLLKRELFKAKAKNYCCLLNVITNIIRNKKAELISVPLFYIDCSLFR